MPSPSPAARSSTGPCRRDPARGASPLPLRGTDVMSRELMVLPPRLLLRHRPGGPRRRQRSGGARMTPERSFAVIRDERGADSVPRVERMPERRLLPADGPRDRLRRSGVGGAPAGHRRDPAPGVLPVHAPEAARPGSSAPLGAALAPTPDGRFRARREPPARTRRGGSNPPLPTGSVLLGPGRPPTAPARAPHATPTAPCGSRTRPGRSRRTPARLNEWPLPSVRGDESIDRRS